MSEAERAVRAAKSHRGLWSELAEVEAQAAQRQREVDRLRFELAETYADGRRWYNRAEAAEAAVARVRELCDAREGLTYPWVAWVRAALDGEVG